PEAQTLSFRAFWRWADRKGDIGASGAVGLQQTSSARIERVGRAFARACGVCWTRRGRSYRAAVRWRRLRLHGQDACGDLRRTLVAHEKRRLRLVSPLGA